VVGDVMADVLAFASPQSDSRSKIFDAIKIKKKDYALATVHRAENTDDPLVLKRILSAFEKLHQQVIVFPVHPRTRKILKKNKYKIPPHILMIEPVGYFEMVALEKSAKMILTDSGGVQKEAYWLRIPCLTLRNETEWTETLRAGWNRLAGTEPDKIVRTFKNFRSPKGYVPLYGDGRAAEKCIRIILSQANSLWGKRIHSGSGRSGLSMSLPHS
jgi:UDP-N-acetylglucosamine 2-epimerase